MVKLKQIIRKVSATVKQQQKPRSAMDHFSPHPPLGFVSRTDPNFYFLSRR